MILSNNNGYAIVSNTGGNILCWRDFSTADNQIDILYPECPYEYQIGTSKTAWTTHGGAHIIAGVINDGGMEEIYTVGVPNVLNMKGSEEVEGGVHSLHFSAQQIKEYSNFKFGIISEFGLKAYEKRKSELVLRTRVRSYEPLPFTLLLVYRLYLPFQHAHSILKIDNKTEKRSDSDEILYFCADCWDSVEVESEFGLTSIQTRKNSAYDMNSLQVVVSRCADFIIVDSIRHMYLMSGVLSSNMQPKLNITFTPY